VEFAVKKSKFREQQIAFALKRAETGVIVKEIICKLGITEHIFYLYGLLPHCRT
jgi:putative transposase